MEYATLLESNKYLNIIMHTCCLVNDNKLLSKLSGYNDNILCILLSRLLIDFLLYALYAV